MHKYIYTSFTNLKMRNLFLHLFVVVVFIYFALSNVTSKLVLHIYAYFYHCQFMYNIKQLYNTEILLNFFKYHSN